VIGSYWANHVNVVKNGNSEKDIEPVEIDGKMVVIYIIGACLMITALYFFRKYLVYIVIGIFCLGSATGLFFILSYFSHGFPSGYLGKVKYIGNISIKYITYTVISIAIPLFWIIVRHQEYAWVIQDFLGIILIMTILKSIKYPNIKITTLLLTLFFIYDIFWVFITPLFTTNGESIMVSVATGGGGGSNEPQETIPLAFMIPRLVNPYYPMCGPAYSILGYGDIVLPGLLVSYCLRFDRSKFNGKKNIFYSYFDWICSRINYYFCSSYNSSNWPTRLTLSSS